MPNSELQRRPAARAALRIEVAQRPDHADRGGEGVVGTAVEQGDEAVAQVLVDEAATGRDLRLHGLQVFVEQRERLLGPQRFGRGGEAAQVGEHDRHVEPGVVGRQHRLDRGPAQEIEELERHEPAVGAGEGLQSPVVFADLGGEGEVAEQGLGLARQHLERRALLGVHRVIEFAARHRTAADQEARKRAVLVGQRRDDGITEPERRPGAEHRVVAGEDSGWCGPRSSPRRTAASPADPARSRRPGRQ